MDCSTKGAVFLFFHGISFAAGKALVILCYNIKKIHHTEGGTG